MYELYPYFTNDGTVGLFSPSDDDIYHSTFGALTESWEKFINPSHLVEYLDKNDDVKILDICYGIGYNTKTALQVFINSCLNNKKNKNNFSKNQTADTNNIAPIDTDNIPSQKTNTKSKNVENINSYNEAIDTDNLCNGIYDSNKERELHEIYENEYNRHILIDAVDVDKILINLSPFITNGITNTKIIDKYLLQKYFNKNLSEASSAKLKQVKKMKETKLVSLPDKYKLRYEVPIILFLKLLKGNSKLLEDPVVQILLTQKKYSPFFSKFMLKFAQFYSNHGYNYVKNINKTSFLHNIYYRYISPSYKNVLELLKYNKFCINFNQNDARRFILSTDMKYNFIFLDAFTPAKSPCLWTVEFFKELYEHLEDDGMLLTYSNSAAIRNAFLLNGFCVGKIYDSKLKRYVGTVATKNQNLIEYPLDDKDIALVNSKAGICYHDEYLEADNKTIILNRELEVDTSNLSPSSHIMKGYSDANA